ncbi:hypothetical protein LdCL_040015900 [Leishmania donovani]|uniref:Uncharacterized protein n=1 Tax=Leishmania donovani TaxID=5661 RepID=A0A3S7WNX4_LEIDO|nr:hypothetical protein LdCL_040015900 [Leishmania donovani]
MHGEGERTLKRQSAQAVATKHSRRPSVESRSVMERARGQRVPSPRASPPSGNVGCHRSPHHPL